MKKIIFTVLIFLCFTFNAFTQTQKETPMILGLAYAAKGEIRADTVFWLDKTVGGTMYFQTANEVATLVELTALKNLNTISSAGFKYYFNVKMGGGVVLLKRKRISFPLFLNIGYAYTIADKAEENLNGISLGYKAGVSCFVTQKLSLVMNYSYDINLGEEVSIAGSPKIDPFSYSTNYISIGLGYSLTNKKKKSALINNY